MGNCLVIQDRKEEIIRTTSMDGSQVVLKVPSASRLTKVRDVSLSVPLPPASVLPVTAPAGTVRVKLVISKLELKKMLDREGVSLDDVVSFVRKEASGREQVEHCCGGWRPALEGIPEGSDL